MQLLIFIENKLRHTIANCFVQKKILKIFFFHLKFNHDHDILIKSMNYLRPFLITGTLL